jgi:hypothetical protein
MRKAFIFTLDALFAVSVLGIFLAVVSFELNMPKETYWLPELGDNFLTSLDKTGALSNILNQTDAQAETALTSYLSTLPQNVNADITVKIYQGVSDVFTLRRTIHVTRDVLNPTQETHIKRIFSGASNYFGIAELVLSYD